MFVRLYNNYLIKEEEVIGIFDLDTATEAPTSRKFLRETEARKKMRVAAKNIPRSFVITDSAVYLSHSSAASIQKSLCEN